MSKFDLLNIFYIIFKTTLMFITDRMIITKNFRSGSFYSVIRYIFSTSKIRVVYLGNFNLKSLLNEFNIPNLSQIYFGIPESLGQTFKTCFWVQNHLLNCFFVPWICKGLFCSQKASVKCLYESFLVYKDYSLFVYGWNEIFLE